MKSKPFQIAMDPKNRIIIDTDPGCDDILAMLLAFAAKPEDVEVMLVSVTHGNVEVIDCLRNVISLFHTINKEREWRRAHQQAAGFDTLERYRPIVAVGAEKPLAAQQSLADFFHGIDGLSGVHTSVGDPTWLESVAISTADSSQHPHFSPSSTWKSLFNLRSEAVPPTKALHHADIEAAAKEHHSFTPSNLAAHHEILRILRDNDKDTITIVAIGPLTNLALAAAEDAETFLRVKEVVVMGGAVDVPGNMTPLAEFNFSADAFAAARVLALTSPHPSTTLPPTPATPPASSPLPPYLLPYPKTLSRRLKLTLLPLDITTPHLLTRQTFNDFATQRIKDGSPLAEWTNAFLTSLFDRAERIGGDGGLCLHDPLAVWYALDGIEPNHSDAASLASTQHWKVQTEQDIRVETTGQWTRGACISDRRPGSTHKRAEGPDADLDKMFKGDHGGWRSEQRGNRVRVVRATGVEEDFGEVLCSRIFGLDE